MLATLERANLLVIALDQRREWYRLHHLVADLLQAELQRRDPARQQQVHRRASEWYESQGDADNAIQQAWRAHDPPRVVSLILVSYMAYAGRGHHGTIRRWLALLTDEQLSANPNLAVFAAFARLTAGEGAAARQWLARAEQAVLIKHPGSAVGATPAVAVAILRASIGRVSAAEMAEDASYALPRAPHGAARAMCCLLLGAAAFMLGDDAIAEERLQEGIVETSGAPGDLALHLAHLAVLQIEHGGWDEATALARRGRALLAENGLEAAPTMSLVTALSSLVEARAGHLAEAQADRLLTRRSLARYVQVAGWANIQVRIALARAEVLLGDRVGARALLDGADWFLHQAPDAVRVKEQLDDVRRSLLQPPYGAGWGPSSLTTAEIRVLQYLPTHLTLADIADRLHVSRNTIKTQAIAIYRKLGISSRGAAVDVAREAGLLDPLQLP